MGNNSPESETCASTSSFFHYISLCILKSDKLQHSLIVLFPIYQMNNDCQTMGQPNYSYYVDDCRISSHCEFNFSTPTPWLTQIRIMQISQT